MSRIERNFKLAKGAAPGLKCTLEGLSLGDAPLLRKTSEGFAPRPPIEIEALLKAAYGEDLTTAGLVPGLNLIARALNEGDLGRAMVAALHLRLPDLGSGGAQRIAKADDELAKYDSSEDRDERGRWTAGGQSDSSDAPSKDHGSASNGDHPLLTPVSDKIYAYIAAFRDKHLADATRLAAVIGHGATADEVLAASGNETGYGEDPKVKIGGNFFGIHASTTDPSKYFPGQIGVIQTKGKPMASFALKGSFYVSGLIFAKRMNGVADGKDLSDPATFFTLAHVHGWGTDTRNYLATIMNVYGLFRNSARTTERRP